MNMQTENPKRFFIHTLGCKVNQYESQAMRELLTGAGFKECLSRELADIYIINTCTVTSRADRESRYMIGLLHRTNPNARIVVTGCCAEDISDSISFLPGISHVIKNADKPKIAQILKKKDCPIPGAMASEPDTAGQAADFASLSISDFRDRTKAFVKIQDGCENACSYCKVPIVRSVLRSKPVGVIVNEVRTLVEKGFREIVLTGICLGAWGRDIFPDAVAKCTGLGGISLVDVLKAVDKVPGDFRMQLSSIEPRYLTNDLIDFMAGNKRVCRHLHIPFQSGDDEILKKMNRPYTAGEYREVVARIRSKIEDIAITTDMLVGFPGETDLNFRNSVNFIKDILPLKTHIFTFSKRKGTAAYAMGPDMKYDVLKGRFHKMNTTAIGTAYLYRQRFMGRTLDVLVETKRDRRTGLLTGYSDNYIKVMFEGPDSLARQIVPVKIKDINLIYSFGAYGEG